MTTQQQVNDTISRIGELVGPLEDALLTLDLGITQGSATEINQAMSIMRTAVQEIGTLRDNLTPETEPASA